VPRSAGARPRLSAKVLLVDTRGRVLLFCGRDATGANGGTFWFPPGGGVEAGETLTEAALRELKEEVGIELAADELGEVVLERLSSFEFEGTRFEQEEHYFLVRVPEADVDASGGSEIERRAIVSYRWWSVAELAATDHTIYPDGLGELLDRHVGHCR
jgi:8-oxo-dGTP pyrophosphatase MutT (NUDIX family)